jgi:hypothetical protein
MTWISTLNIRFFRICVGMLSQGLTGMLGLGDGVVFVCFLTLLVKKKEKRGRRVSAVS